MPAPPDLQDLLARCRRREPSAQLALYKRYAGVMMGVCMRYARSQAEAEDILQDAFVKVFHHLDAFRGDGSLEGWIRRIVVSTAIDAYHKHRHQRQQSNLDDYHHLSTPDADALDRLTVEEVLALVQKLPDGCRMVLMLYTMEGYSHAEIGQMLGITEGASKAQLSKARARLVKMVEQQTALPPRVTNRASDPDEATYHFSIYPAK